MKTLRSEATAGVLCLPRMPLTVPEPQKNGIPTESTQRGHEITIRDFKYIKRFIQKLQNIRLP